MQPPIPIGTILQNRYRVLSILGQGGFGRTYLAEDQGRFNERCALKEFIPNTNGTYALDKSKELFQREAAILYQIQHPQIPQFRATFEENQRLFLVQDYVEGKTYRTLLNERKSFGSVFSEPEVLLFLRQILPVLAHIHARGIIHRDIAPDNIILRESDRVPVLIDFGVVKELATRVSGDPAMPATSVGKVGYAPSEQMLSGQATPSSDLYALAVTAIVLLTGKEPQELLDQHTLVWSWQQWTKVSP
ncbi:MAG: protein kinase domain-containing protein, partial [Microcoleaceae cyanobacterium]